MYKSTISRIKLSKSGAHPSRSESPQISANLRKTSAKHAAKQLKKSAREISHSQRSSYKLNVYHYIYIYITFVGIYIYMYLYR